MKKFVAVLALLLVAVLCALFALSHRTTLALDPGVKVIGAATPVTVKLDNPSGVKRVAAFLEQNGQRYLVFEERQPASRFFFWRHKQAPREVKFTAGQKQAPNVKEGKARFLVAAEAADLRGASDEVSRDVEVILRPPTVVADGLQHYINQGGCELVRFTPGGYWTESGVRVGKYTFRSFPVPGSPNERFSLFGFPWDLPAGTVPVVYARNPAGTEATARFWFKVFPKQFRKRDLDIGDSFLQKVVPEIDGQGSGGDLLPRFLKINGDLRRQNNQTLADLRLKTAEQWLWTEPFQQLGNSKVESQFADTRSYMYQGKKVDEQTHLGFDLSVTQHVPVQASNDGRVVWADRLGIYGNCIVVDHGYGLQSIYGHLSQIDVKPGDMVKKGQVMGRSGSTGLAGGDHLHYSMQVDGVQVNPVEWWDAHWIKDRVFSKIPPKS